MIRRLVSLSLLLIVAVLARSTAALQDTTPSAPDSPPALLVTDVLPTGDSAPVAADSVITVIFNRPVVPLTMSTDAAGLPDPISITPAVAGSGEWLNTSIYVFRPTDGLAGGTPYTVTVNAGLTAVDGAVLAEPYTWTFQTEPPSIIELTPTNQMSGVPLGDPVVVTFNQPMDRASVEAGFSLSLDGDEFPVNGTFNWSENDTRMTFQPAQPLQYDSVYRIDFGTGVRSVGGAALVGERTFAFATVPLPGILRTDPFDGQADVSPYYGAFQIYFASPMNIETLEDRVTIEPTPSREPDFYFSEYDNTYVVNFPLEPSTAYRVTIAPGMEDIYGNRIETETVVNFTTAPYDPNVMLQVPGQVGFYNAYNDPTRLFLTYQNISRLDLELFNVPLDVFASAFGPDSYYAPADVVNPGRTIAVQQWQIDTSEAEQNETRYQLIELGTGGVAAGATGGTPTCTGAPPSRLQVGDTAVVITDPDPLRARSAPVDGEILAQLYRDYSLPIIGGPVCANSLLWWEVTLREGGSAWVAEGTPEEYFIDVRFEAQSTPVNLGTPLAAGALPPGTYLLTVTSPEQTALGYTPTRHLLVVGTANLTFKLSFDEALVWATDVNSGAPIVDAPVTIYDAALQTLATATTDAEGIARFSVPDVNDLYATRIAVLNADGQFGVTVSQWSEGIEPYQFGHGYTTTRDAVRAYVYSDRPIYRPDQPVYFRGIVRTQDDVTFTPPSADSVPVTIVNEQGETVYEKTLPLTEYGTFSDTFQLAPDAALGFYRIIAQLPGTDEFYYGDNGTLGFRVGEYRAPEFQVNVTPVAPEVANGEQIEVAVDSRYFFGGAVSDADVRYSVVNAPYYFEYTGSGRYSFIDFDYDGGSGEYYFYGGEQIASGTGVTDAQGMYVIQVPADLGDATSSQLYTIEATVTDESDQAVSNRTDVVVHKGLLYVGVGPENYVGEQGEVQQINLIAVDWESNPVAEQMIDVTVVERRWSSVQEQDASGRTTWSYEVEDIPVTTGSAQTDANGRAVFQFTPPNGGVFRITATTRDTAGNTVIASDTIWVSGDDYVAWRQQNSNRIDLIADSTSYDVGDTAQILIASPFEGSAEALITVEREGVLLYERVTMTTNSYVFELPITEDFAPNVFVSAMIVKGVDENTPVAQFRMGEIELAVSSEQKAITIAITPNVEQAGPGDVVEYSVLTTDYQGNPVSAEVGVGLTDLSVLTIADPNSPPILRFFYGLRGLAVRTATPLTINTDLLTQVTLDTVKGGGGGFGEGGIFDIRQDFVDTAYWNATLSTDANGMATFSVTLPDNLTTWRLDARAVTSGENGLTLVGQDTFDLLSTKPLLIRPVTPRFFVEGDLATVAAIVNNNTPDEQTVAVTLQSSGLTMQSETTQTVTIAPSGRARVEWQVAIDAVENVDLTFFANGNDGEYTDASKPPLGLGDERLLPVYRYEVPETVGTGGTVDAGASVTEAIALPQDFAVTEGELTVQLEPSLAATTVEGLRFLRNFPHQCTEQTVSRFLPNIITYRALSALGIQDDDLEFGLTENVAIGVQLLYAQQHVDGGWGWFVNDQSNPLTTAYALIGLSEARDQGFTISAASIANAQTFLQTTLIVPDLSQPEWALNRQAFVLYALARSGSPDAARTASLFEVRDRLDNYAKAFLALALARIDGDDTSRTDALLSDLVNAATLSATGAYWSGERDVYNWNTDTRTTAIALQAFIELDPDNALIPNIVRYLMTQRTADAWETTQETAWAVMGLTSWMVQTGELQPDYSYSVTFNNAALVEEVNVSPADVTTPLELRVSVADMLRDQANQLVITRSDGPGALYYTAHVRAFLPVAEVEPLDNGIIIERRYVRAGETARTPVTSAQVGETLQVRLTVIVPSDLHYVTIEDPIPAGTDAVDPSLNTSQQIGTQPELNISDPLSQGWGWWYFSNIEFRDEKVVLYSTYLPAGTYEFVYSIRAGLAGTYNVIPPYGYEFYFPEVYGRGAGSIFTITAAEE